MEGYVRKGDAIGRSASRNGVSGIVEEQSKRVKVIALSLRPLLLFYKEALAKPNGGEVAPSHLPFDKWMTGNELEAHHRKYIKALD